MSHLRATVALAIILLVAACGAGDASKGASSRQSGERPFLLLQADGWELSDAAASSTPGTIWLLNYEHDAGEGQFIPAALTLFERAKADELASQVSFEDTDVKIEGQVVSVWTERSTQDGHLIATHIRWKASQETAWLTVYETDAAEAMKLVRKVKRVGEAKWHDETAGVLDQPADAG